jgi:superfamily I DNA/RNA helicase
VFETELRRMDIPYVLVGSQSFFDKKEVRDLMAYLKALAFPQDDISLMRIINTPTRGIGASTVEKISTRAVQQGCHFFEAVESSLKEGDISRRQPTLSETFKGYSKHFGDARTRKFIACPTSFMNSLKPSTTILKSAGNTKTKLNKLHAKKFSKDLSLR